MLMPNLTTGLDVSDRYSTFFTLTADGETEEEGRMRTTARALRVHFEGPHRRIVLEAGPHSPWISRLLAELGHEVIVANARMVALIHKNPRKSDPVDAESLARLGRVDPKLLAPIEHRSEEAQIHLGIIRTRDVVVCATRGSSRSSKPSSSCRVRSAPSTGRSKSSARRLRRLPTGTLHHENR